MEMSTTTAEEWLRDYTENEDWTDARRGVHAIRSFFDVLPDHPCGHRSCLGVTGSTMQVKWDEWEEDVLQYTGEGLNPRPEYPTARRSASAPHHTNGRAR